QPHQLDIALRFALQAAAGLDTVEVAVDVDLEQNRRVVGRPPCRRRLRAFKAQGLQIELVDERVDDAHWVVFTDVVVETLWQQGDLASVFSLDESLHAVARSAALPQFRRAPSPNQSVFTQPRSTALLAPSVTVRRACTNYLT